MNLNQLGWKKYKSKQSPELTTETVGRIGVENKTNFVIHSPNSDLQGIIQGKFRHTTKDSSNFPKVGDWVVYEKLPNEDKAIIQKVLPRYSLIARKSAGDSTEPQIIAANVDVLFIVFGLDHDFNAPLLERYLSMAHEGSVTPVIVLNKTDKSKYSEATKKQAEKMSQGTLVFAISAKTELGVHHVEEVVESGHTFAFVGPSGAGKSTLINALIGSQQQTTGEVRLVDAKGRHTTTRREMFFLPNGGILIDTPGIRELETLSTEDMVKTFFADIEAIAGMCRYKDCDHIKSQNCAVVKALEVGRITELRYENYIKLMKEAAYYSSPTNNKDMSWKRKRDTKKAFKSTNEVERKAGRKKVN